MNVLLLTSSHLNNLAENPTYQQESTYQIFRQLAAAGHQAVLARYDEVVITLQSGRLLCQLEGEDLRNFDLVFFRTTSESQYGIFNGALAEVIARYCVKNRIKAVNAKHLLNFSHDFNKLFQLYFLASQHFPIAKSYFVRDPQLLTQLDFPLVRKPLQGSHGDGVQLVQTAAAVAAADNLQLWQNVLPDRKDARILVLKHKCLGAIERRAPAGQFVSNYSAGGSVSALELDKPSQKMAEKLSRLFQLDFCGIDLMRDKKGKWLILEVNRFPEFAGFMKATGIDVPLKLMQSFCH